MTSFFLPLFQRGGENEPRESEAWAANFKNKDEQSTGMATVLGIDEAGREFRV